MMRNICEIDICPAVVDESEDDHSSLSPTTSAQIIMNFIYIPHDQRILQV